MTDQELYDILGYNGGNVQGYDEGGTITAGMPTAEQLAAAVSAAPTNPFKTDTSYTPFFGQSQIYNQGEQAAGTEGYTLSPYALQGYSQKTPTGQVGLYDPTGKFIGYQKSTSQSMLDNFGDLATKFALPAALTYFGVQGLGAGANALTGAGGAGLTTAGMGVGAGDAALAELTAGAGAGAGAGTGMLTAAQLAELAASGSAEFGAAGAAGTTGLTASELAELAREAGASGASSTMGLTAAEVEAAAAREAAAAAAREASFSSANAVTGMTAAEIAAAAAKAGLTVADYIKIAGLGLGLLGGSKILGGDTAPVGSGGYEGGIPQYTANRRMLPIPTTTTTGGITTPRRPGSGGITYFTPMSYTPGAGTGIATGVDDTGTVAADTTGKKTVSAVNPNARTDAAKQAYSYMQGLISSGDEAGAKAFYLAKQKELGFSDDEFAKLSGSPFSGTQIGEWKVNPATGAVTKTGTGTAATTTATGGTGTTTAEATPSQADVAKQAYSYMQGLISKGDEAGAKAFYNSKQGTLGFSDADFAKLSGSPFSATQLSEWKNATAPVTTAATTTTAPVTTAATTTTAPVTAATTTTTPTRSQADVNALYKSSVTPEMNYDDVVRAAAKYDITPEQIAIARTANAPVAATTATAPIAPAATTTTAPAHTQAEVNALYASSVTPEMSYDDVVRAAAKYDITPEQIAIAKAANTPQAAAPYVDYSENRANGGLIPHKAAGGFLAAAGGIANLGSYSDGGRLLRGPGDGVSDSIPATIGSRQPARLADGEFVIPARIVSEIGNGSTEAGARKLYAMMERIKKARRATKNIAANTKADRYLPA